MFGSAVINGFGSVALECKRQQLYGQECFNHGLMLDFQLKAILIQIPLHAWTNFFIRVQSSTFFVTNKGHMTRSNVSIAATA
jgi:hypothetical protein